MRNFVFFLMVCYVALASANEKPEPTMQKVMKLYGRARSRCIMSTGVDETKVTALEQAEMIDDILLYCYIGCIMNRMDIIDENGQLLKSQIFDVYQAISDGEFNENAKLIIRGLVIDLKHSKSTCDSGRICMKFLQTVIERA